MVVQSVCPVVSICPWPCWAKVDLFANVKLSTAALTSTVDGLPWQFSPRIDLLFQMNRNDLTTFARIPAPWGLALELKADAEMWCRIPRYCPEPKTLWYNGGNYFTNYVHYITHIQYTTKFLKPVNTAEIPHIHWKCTWQPLQQVKASWIVSHWWCINVNQSVNSEHPVRRNLGLHR